MDFNLEAALVELDNFQLEPNDVSPLLEDYLRVIAKTGNILFPWNKLQPLLKRKMDLVLAEFSKACPPENVPSLPNTETFDFDTFKVNLLDAIDAFPNAPFTIQRICELIVNPRKYYSRTDKYMRGLEKNLLVVSTVESIASDNVRNQPSIVNGSAAGPRPTYQELCASIHSTLANRIVLENFATVFPCATSLVPPSNNIQVPTIPENNDFLDSECSVNFEYDDNANSSDMENAGSDVASSDSITDTTAMVSEEIENTEKSLSEENSELVDENAKCPESNTVSDSKVSLSIESSDESLPHPNSALQDTELPEIQNTVTYAKDLIQDEKPDVLPMDTSTVQEDCEEPSAKRIKLDTSDVDERDDDLNEQLDGNKSPENAVGYEKEEIDEMVIRKINSHEQDHIEVNGTDNTNEQKSENIADETSEKIIDDELECKKKETDDVATESVTDSEEEQKMDETGGDDVQNTDCGKDEVEEQVAKNLQSISESCGDVSQMV